MADTMSKDTRKDLAVCSSLLDQAWCDLTAWTDQIGRAETQNLLRLLQQPDANVLLYTMATDCDLANVVKDLAYAALMETLVRRGRRIVEDELEAEELRCIEDANLPNFGAEMQ